MRQSILGTRLEECTRLVNAIEGKSANDIFGATDQVKFRSSITLFRRAAEPGAPFASALDKYFGGEEDDLTVGKLRLS